MFYLFYICLFFFFFQAEDGIRDTSVTGVQTCALPICPFLKKNPSSKSSLISRHKCLGICIRIAHNSYFICCTQCTFRREARSEERRVGKECRCRWSPYK